MKFSILLFSFCLAAGSLAGAAEPTANAYDKQALQLLKKMPASNYGARRLCIYLGKYAVGVYSGGHWSISLLARGTTEKFPLQTEKLTGTTKVPFEVEYPNGPNDWNRFNLLESAGSVKFYASKGKVDGRPADACVFENRPTLESVGG